MGWKPEIILGISKLELGTRNACNGSLRTGWDRLAFCQRGGGLTGDVPSDAEESVLTEAKEERRKSRPAWLLVDGAYTRAN